MPNQPGIRGPEAPAARGDEPRQLIRAQRCVVGRGEAVIDDAVVALENGRISRLGRAADFGTALEQSAATDYGDATILPGLIDAHAHLTLRSDGSNYDEMRSDPDELLALISARNMWRHLRCGVTTIRDNGGRGKVTFALREAIRRGYLRGPRLLLAGRPVTRRQGHFWWCGSEADDSDELRAVVRALVADGADHIKVMASGGGTKGTTPWEVSYGLPELRAIVDTAHDLGRLTTAHCHARAAISLAVEAGIDCIEHATFLIPPSASAPPPEIVGVAVTGFNVEYDSRVAERMLEAGTYVGFTFAGGYSAVRRLEARRDAGDWSKDDARTLTIAREHMDRKLYLFRRLVADGMGSRLATSSDAGPGDNEFGQMWLNLDLAVMGGHSPVQAVEAATRIAAESCGIADEVGSIEPGKAADVLVVAGDATADVRRIADVVEVYFAGSKVDLIGASWIGT